MSNFIEVVVDSFLDEYHGVQKGVTKAIISIKDISHIVEKEDDRCYIRLTNGISVRPTDSYTNIKDLIKQAEVNQTTINR